MLIQKQSCSSCAIFVGSIFSSRFISVLGHKVIICKSNYFTSYINLLLGSLPDSIQHFRGILEFVFIYMYPWENYHTSVLFTIPIK